MINKNLIIYLSILIFGLIAPFIFPAFKVQLSILCVLIILAITWNIQGGEMGYNSFGNILFYGLGMYLCASVQVGMFFPLAEWTESGGEKTFVHTPVQFFQGIAVGLAVAAVIPAIVAGLIGYSILGLRGHYFAIGTLGLGVAAGEISGGIEIIGAGQGFTTPPFPNVGSLEARGEFFYYCSFVALVLTFIAVKSIYSTRFKLVLNAIRDNEDKAEAMGIQTMKYKIIGWMISAFFCGLAGGIMGGLVGYIDSTDVAFDGREMGVFMVLMAILGGKGTLWGPVIGATIFHIFKEGFWTFFLGWQYVALGVLIVVIAKLGLLRTFQQTRIYGKLNCVENMLISHKASDESLVKIFSQVSKNLTEKAENLLNFVGLYQKRKLRAGDLSFGQQKLLELAMALMNEPEMLLLDEPTAGINPTLINGIIDRLIKVNQDFGITLLVIEHNMRVIMNLAQKILCLAHGELLAEGSPEQIKNDKRVIDAYLGAK